MMKLGSQGIAAIYLGGQKIKKAYLGEAVVFDTAGPPEPVTYTITLSVDPQGGGTVTGGGSVEEGMSVTVSSTPASGYTFSGWRENGAIVSTSPSYTFTVTSDRSLTAVFAAVIPTYRVTAGIDPEGSGTATGAGTYQQGASVTVTASPGDGYKFVKWTEGGQTVSENASYTFTVSGDRALVAVFEAEQTSRLPAGYTEVEYVQSTGSQVLNTSVAIANTLRIEADMEIVDTRSTTTRFMLFGAFASSKNLSLAYDNTYLKLVYNYSATKNFGNRNSYGRINADFNLTARSFNVNGDAISLTTLNLPSASIYIFNSASDASGASKAKLYKFDISNASSGGYVRQFVPCKDPSGVVGLFDLVTNSFYKPNTGVLTAGPAV